MQGCNRENLKNKEYNHTSWLNGAPDFGILIPSALFFVFNYRISDKQKKKMDLLFL